MRIERRATARVAATGSVVVRLNGTTQGRVIDLSAGGVRFELPAGEARYAPGATIVIDVRLDGATFGWFRFIAVVNRSSAGETAAAFTDVPAQFADAIGSELRAAVKSVEIPGVLLVDVDAPRRVLLAAALRTAGCQVSEVATPLDVISYLEDSQARPWLVAIADTVPATIADELRAYMRSSHALIRLVAGDETGTSDAIARLVASRLD